MTSLVTPSAESDRGFSLVEVLISIILLGTAGVAVLGAMGSTVRGSAVHQDHTNAYAWLQSATDSLAAAPRQDCDLGETAVRNAYQTVIQGVENPQEWPAANITVIDIKFWDGNTFQGDCFDNVHYYLQQITLQVRNLDGQIIERVEVIKGEDIR